MIPIVLAFSGDQMAQKIERILSAEGYLIARICHSGAEVLRTLEKEERILLISSYRLSDLSAHEILEMAGGRVYPLILLNPAQNDLGGDECAMYLRSPITRADLISSVKMLDAISGQGNRSHQKASRQERPTEERALITAAKELLMERYHMSEETAHRFMQKESMNHKRKMADTARLILEGS